MKPGDRCPPLFRLPATLGMQLTRRSARRVAARQSLGAFLLAFLRDDKVAILHFQDAVSDAEVTVVMGGGNDRLPPPLEVGEDNFVKVPPEDRVLIRRPFIKNVNRLIFKKADQQREPLALS